MKKITAFMLITSSMVLAPAAQAQFAKPEQAIKYRKSALFVMQQNFGRVAAMAQGKVPFDPKVAAESAAVAEYMGKLPWAGFVEGSDKGETDAKPEIWKEQVKFNDYADKMQQELAKLSIAAKTGELGAIKTAVGGVGKTCKTCHDAFKKE